MPKSKAKNTSNKARPSATIMLDRERTLRFDLNAMAAFEEATGDNLFNGTFQLGNLSARGIRAMLWACLLSDDEALTIQQVGSLITTDNMGEITQALLRSFEVAAPPESDRPLPETVSPNGTG